MSLKYTVGICPSPILDDSMEYDNKDSAISESKNGSQTDVTVYMCPINQGCQSGLFITIKMCPEGEECSCGYTVENLQWYDNGLCGINILWNNPDKCILRQVNLEYMSWWDQNYIIKYTHDRVGEISPTFIIYPDGDERNKIGCRDCGIGGSDTNHEAGSELIYETELMTPGMAYKVTGFFDDLSCGGRNVKHDLGYVLYQTTGFTSGLITSLASVRPRMYNVQFWERDAGSISLKEMSLFTSDYTDYEIGDAVMLVKMGTDFPSSDHIYTHLYPTSNNVDQVTSRYTEKMFITPYTRQRG